MTFRARLALAMGALILLIAIAISVYLPRKFEAEAMALIGQKAETLAELTAFTIHPAIYFNDRAALEEALSGARRDLDVAYIIVTGADGQRLSAFRPERARSAGLLEVTKPIREGNRELARLQIGMSLARLHAEVREMRVAIGVLSAIILGIGLLAVVLLSNLLTRPLRHVAAGAQQVAAGDLGHRVPEGRRDEIGQLATSFNDMAARVAERDAALRQLSKRMLSIQEQERVRIAREVHDELGQALTAMKIDIQQLARREPPLAEPLASISRSVDMTVDLVRRIATDLRPAILDDLGVTAALEQQLRRLRESTGMQTTLTVAEEPELDMLTGVTLYRIAKEALANVVRHAEATEVAVSLAIEGGAAVLEIGDNGKGMSPDQIASRHSLGLLGIRERAELLGGSVAIESSPGGGTRVRATLPLGKDDPNLANPVR
ncbi:MAG TPA: HAMP domain-containing protein [Thermoanaerobaculia bacterium]